MKRADRTARRTLASPWLPRAGRLTFGAGLLVGAGIGICLAFGPLRAVATSAGERARDACGELVRAARCLGDRGRADQAFVDLSTTPGPALAGGGGDPGEEPRLTGSG